VSLYIDSLVMQHPWVIVGGGDRSSKLKLPPSELAELPGAEVIEGLSLSPTR
jgi:prolyl-tRNA editing enzyme YbaK/EbsC (Cys-tRNA(Pro) deacylase)